MTEVLIGAAVVVGLVLLLWPRLFGEPDEHIQTEEERHRVRMARLNEAYEYAKEDLGREPTNDEILLTRDTLEDINGTP